MFLLISSCNDSFSLSNWICNVLDLTENCCSLSFNFLFSSLNFFFSSSKESTVLFKFHISFSLSASMDFNFFIVFVYFSSFIDKFSPSFNNCAIFSSFSLSIWAEADDDVDVADIEDDIFFIFSCNDCFSIVNDSFLDSKTENLVSASVISFCNSSIGRFLRSFGNKVIGSDLLISKEESLVETAENGSDIGVATFESSEVCGSMLVSLVDGSGDTTLDFLSSVALVPEVDLFDFPLLAARANLS